MFSSILNSCDSLVEFTVVSHFLHLYFPFHVITMPIKRDLSLGCYHYYNSTFPFNSYNCFFIFSGGGLVLEKTIDSYRGFEVFQPVINGIGGNLVSVQASRMSTLLHQTSIMGSLDKKDKIWVSPWRALFYGSKSMEVTNF